MSTISKEKIEELKAYPIHYRLQMLRGCSGYTQKEFAALVGVTQNCISKWERGFSQPFSKNLMKIVQILDLPCDFFADVEIEKLKLSSKKKKG